MVYLREAFAELWRQDGLVVVARGLGIRRLLAKFLLLHCMHGDAPTPSPLLEYDAEEGKEDTDVSPEVSSTAATAATAAAAEGEGTGTRAVAGSTPDRVGKQRATGRLRESGATAGQEASPPPRSRTSAIGGGPAQQQQDHHNRADDVVASGIGEGRSQDARGGGGGGGGGGGEGGAGGRPLVLCLNTKGEEDLFFDALMEDGIPPNRLPEVVDSECTPAQRQGMYRAGGVFMITSRVLIVDLLNKTVLPQRISGMLVHKAHRVVETSSEAFILRIYREGNHSGFVKGFTDEPESLLSGFGKLEKILRNLGVPKVFLWPRFHSLVAEVLERHPPEVEELVQGLTGPMKEVQQAIVVLMDHTLKELRGTAPSLESGELTVENCIFHSFDRSVKRQLEPEWHRVGFKTKQLLQDLNTLRSLLDYVFRYDAITFYNLLLAEKSKAAAVRDPPLWIGTPAAERLFVSAKARIYKIQATTTTTTTTATSPRTAAAAAAMINRDRGDDASKGAISKGSGRRKEGSASTTAPPLAAASSYELNLVLEENAKWHLAADVLKEIQDVHQARCRKKANADGGTPGGGVLESAGGARVLVLVRDEHSCEQIRQYSALGGPLMMKRRFLEFLREAEARTGRVAAAKGANHGSKHGDRRNSSSSSGGGGRWSGNSNARRMTGVGIGASPVFSSRGVSKAGRGGEGGDQAGERRNRAGTERQLLKEAENRLEVELSASSSFSQQHHHHRRHHHHHHHHHFSKKSREISSSSLLSSAAASAAASSSAESSSQNTTTFEGVDLTGGDDSESSPVSAKADSTDSVTTAARGRGRDRRRPIRRPAISGAGATRDADEGSGEADYDVPFLADDWGQDGGARGSGGGGLGKWSGQEAAGLRFEPLPSMHAVMFSYVQAAESLNILQDLEPDFVVLYDPDAAFVRTLEAYQAGRSRERPPLSVYFMLYEQSVEEQRYLTSLDRETKAFKSLIEEKARMTVPVRNMSASIPSDGGKGTAGKVTRLSAPAGGAGGVGVGDGGGSADGGGGGSAEGQITSRRGGGRKFGEKKPLKVVVDLREFRSVLPNLLHQRGFELVPLVIAVGDYVLTPEICVERKSLSDLFQSMSSGRLFNQVESILKHYKVPVLLIEFHPDKAFCLLGCGDLNTDIKLTSITSQLALLTLHFPQLRILWSKSEHATADIFKELMKNNAQVDVAKAQAAGGGGDEEGGTGDETSTTARELLMRLPGVNVHNYRNVLRKVDTIADLCSMSEEQLRPLLGAGNASKLYKFCRQPAPL